jgi:aminocarboxymuconate-semialdehyde decarboxylase
VIDMHAHVMVSEVEALVAGQEGRAREAAQQAGWMSADSVAHNRSLAPHYAAKFADVAVRVADMDAMGVDIQAISTSPTQYNYWADRALAEKLVAAANAFIAAQVAANPSRFTGLGAVALQHPDLAVEQLTHGIRGLGLKGVEVSTRVLGRELADSSLEPFWARAEELGAVVFIHPLGCTLGERLAPYYLGNVIGNPTETTVALSHLIFSGLLDRHPALKICAAHGGGYLPYYIARSDHAYEVRPESRTVKDPPSAYLRRIWFDSLLYGPVGLRHLVEQVGSSQVVLGTDYPFDMGVMDPLERLAAAGLAPEVELAIRGGNAAALLRLDTDHKPPPLGSANS